MGKLQGDITTLLDSLKLLGSYLGAVIDGDQEPEDAMPYVEGTIKAVDQFISAHQVGEPCTTCKAIGAAYKIGKERGST